MGRNSSGFSRVWHKAIIALAVILILLGGITAAGFAFFSVGFF